MYSCLIVSVICLGFTVGCNESARSENLEKGAQTKQPIRESSSPAIGGSSGPDIRQRALTESHAFILKPEVKASAKGEKRSKGEKKKKPGIAA
jgi:hypothetical protein